MSLLRRRALMTASVWAAAGALGACAGPETSAPSNATLPVAPPVEVVVYAAGSLRAALTQFGRDFEAGEPGVRLRFVFGASGLLKDRLLAGEPADVFASANLEHPSALAQAGRSGPVQRFARNRLCVLAHPQAGVTAGNVLDRLLDPAVRLGTSTPVADPSGDYTWALFKRIDARGGRYAGAYAQLERKALQLTGGPQSPKSPDQRSVYTWIVDTRQADAFITYCTGVQQAVTESPSLQRIELPDDVNVAADYGIVRLQADGPNDAAARTRRELAQRFIDRLRGPGGQAVLAQWGFAPG